MSLSVAAQRRALLTAGRLASGRLSAGVIAPVQIRSLAVSAAAVKALASEQKAISDAVGALGADISYEKAKALVEADPAFKATLDKIRAEDLSWTWSMLESKPTKTPVTVAIAGAGSDVGAATLFRIAAGEMLGLDQPVNLQLLGADAAVTKELEACGFPLLKGVTSASSPSAVMKDAAYAIVLEGDAKACGAAAKKGALVAVSGNTNALAASGASGQRALWNLQCPLRIVLNVGNSFDFGK